MYFLAIETTGAFASVALMQDDKVLEHIRGNDRFSHLQHLMPQVKQVLTNRKMNIDDLDAIAVSRGPGSFTGIRIGISSSRALCQVLGIPAAAVSSLAALAMRAADFSENASLDKQMLICPILDARRSQIYGGGYILQDGYPLQQVKAGAYTVDEFMAQIEKYDNILLLGDGTDAYGESIVQARSQAGKDTLIAPEAIRYQDAATVGKLGAKLISEGAGLPYQELLPDYMRQAEAERKLAEKRAAEASGPATS